VPDRPALDPIRNADKIVTNYYLLDRVMPRSARNLPADERRAVTVEAVIALAGKQNPSDITTAAIAQQMGLTQGALFRHFPNKDAILLAVMEWVAERLLGRVDKAIEAAPSPIAALEAAFMAHIDFVVKHPGVPRILFGELQREEVSPAKLVVRRLIRDYSSRLNRTRPVRHRHGGGALHLQDRADVRRARRRLDVHVGDHVKAGQVLGEMDPVDLDDRVRSRSRIQACAGGLARSRGTAGLRRPRRAAMSNCLRCARPARKSSPPSGRNCRSPMPPCPPPRREDIARARADREGTRRAAEQSAPDAPVDGVVAVRDADPGTTIVAGQSVVE
jgi:AcrR family transcriptional regulator